MPQNKVTSKEVLAWFEQAKGKVLTADQVQGVVTAVNVYAPFDLSPPPRATSDEKILDAIKKAKDLQTSLHEMRHALSQTMPFLGVDNLLDELKTFLQLNPPGKQGKPAQWRFIAQFLVPPIRKAIRAADPNDKQGKIPEYDEEGRFCKSRGEDHPMANAVRDHLMSLHTHAVDARHGYEEALEQAEGKGLTPTFREMIALHTQNKDELNADLHRLGEVPDVNGSFMSTIHRTIMDVRSLFGGLGQSVLPGLIDGEERNTATYEKALALIEMPPEIKAHLVEQKGRLAAAIMRMRAQET